MAKTLKKARKKAALAAEGGVSKPELGTHKKGSKVNYAAKISDLLQARKWSEALNALEEMRAVGQLPKLGSVMRWVRAADLAGTESISAQLLAAILHAAAGPDADTSTPRNGPSAGMTAAVTDTAAFGGVPVRRFAPWLPSLDTAATDSSSLSQALQQAPAALGAAGQCSSWALSSRPDAAAAPGAADPARSMPNTEEHKALPSCSPAPAMGELAGVSRSQAKNQQGTALVPAACHLAHAAERWAGTFGVVPLPPETKPGSSKSNAQQGNAGISVGSVGAPPGALPNLAKEVVMYCTLPGTVQFGPDPVVQRTEVPFVPGAFLLSGVLSPNECEQLVSLAEAMGYVEDPDYVMSAQAAAASSSGGVSASAARNGGSGGGERGAAGVVWLADESLQGPLYRRVAPLLPQVLGGGALAGINARWRLYRYDKGAVYRPHVDGAWPGSGLKDGHYVFDAYGDRWSRLTFLVYLNDGFEGGATTFYVPAEPGSGACLDARSVQPKTGNVLVFPHGDTMGSLVHEGAAVTKGSKYVIRTDVLYMLPKKDGNQRCGGKAQPAAAVGAAGGSSGGGAKRK